MKNLVSNRGVVWFGVLLAFSVTVQNAWSAYDASLRGIQLNSSPSQTEIILRSDAKIPHRLVSRSREKIVIDIGGIDATHSIPTDFAQADNIEQVILKPLSGDQVRMVIRGEDMGSPKIRSGRFKRRTQSSEKATVLFEGDSSQSNTIARAHVSTPDQQADGFALSALADDTKPADKTLTSATTPAVGNSTEPAEEPVTLDSEEEDFHDRQTLNELADLDSETLPFRPHVDRPAIVDSVTDGETVDTEEASLSDYLSLMLSNVADSLRSTFIEDERSFLYQVCAFTGLTILIGLGMKALFGRRRRTPFGEQLFVESQPKQPGFLARLFGPKPKRRKTLASRPTPQAPALPTPRLTERPVGLHGLTQSNPQQSLPTGAGPTNMALQRNQALNQYAQQAATSSSVGQRRTSSQTDYELKRSLQVRESTYNSQNRNKAYSTPAKPLSKKNLTPPQATRQAPASANQRPAVSTGRQAMNTPPRQTAQRGSVPAAPTAGLPQNNTEVLEFLRSVAELMDKDGQANVAEGIKRGLAARGQV